MSVAPPFKTTPRCAVIICTCNRPDDLKHTLDSLMHQRASSPAFRLVVVDASAAPQRLENEAAVDNFPGPSHYLPYSTTPSLTRQRNYGLDALPNAIEYVLFLDDDVTLHSHCLQQLLFQLEDSPEAGGVGGCDVSIRKDIPLSKGRALLKYFFLLDHPQPGRVLLSGAASAPHNTRSMCSVQWLSGFCMAFRRALLEEKRFDPALEGYSLHEDLDASYRMSQHAHLIFDPDAMLTHRRSATNRHDAAQYTFDATVNRYWFVEKNIAHPLRKPAYWWATLGQALAILTSSKPEKWDALRGLWQGVHAVWRRSHPLLRDHGIVNNTDRLAA